MVLALAKLLPGSGSKINGSSLTWALAVSVPVVVGETVKVTVAVVPVNTLPSKARIALPELANVPCVVVEPIKMEFVGNKLVTTTPVAVNGPLFVTVTVYPMVPPLMAGLGVASIETAMSAVGFSTRVNTVAELFDVSPSDEDEPTVAVLEIIELVCGITITVTVALL